MELMEKKIEKMSDKELNTLLKKAKGKKLYQLAKIIEKYQKKN